MKKMIFSLMAIACISIGALAQLPPGNYTGEDCSLTVFSDGSMVEVCDDGTGTVYSKSTPIGGCAGAFLDCEGTISFN